MTSAALIDPDVLMIGDLRQHRRGPEPKRPYLCVSAWCAHCRHPHIFPWPDNFRLESVEVVDLTCRGDRPWAGRRVLVGLDPDRRAEHQRLSEHHAEQLRRFLVERRLAHQFADQRARDRTYYRDYPDALPLPTPCLPFVPQFSSHP
jgi:hypothetical protein